jgi:hypothetical protein
MNIKFIFLNICLSLFAFNAHAKITSNFTKTIITHRTSVNIEEVKGVYFWLTKEMEMDCNDVWLNVNLKQHSPLGSNVQQFSYSMSYLSTHIGCGEEPTVKKIVSTKRVFIPKIKNTKPGDRDFDKVKLGVEYPDGWTVHVEEVLEEQQESPIQLTEKIRVSGVP